MYNTFIIYYNIELTNVYNYLATFWEHLNRTYPKKQDSLNRELNFIEPLFVLIIEVRDEILRTREVALR